MRDFVVILHAQRLLQEGYNQLRDKSTNTPAVQPLA